MPYRETLLNASAVYLFGRLVSDLEIAGAVDSDDGDRLPHNGDNNFLRRQVRNKKAAIARIYAFSFEGAMYELDRPSLFIVHGGGQDPDAPGPEDADLSMLSRSPGRVTKTGVGRQSGSFSRDMRVWIYDKGDFSVRLDVETGTLERILLSFELDEDDWSSDGRSGGGRSGGGRSGGGRSGGGRSGGGRSGGGRSGGVMAR